MELPKVVRGRRHLRRLVVVGGVAALAAALGVTGFTATAASAAAVGPITGYGGKCVDVAGANTANGTAVQLYTCNGTVAQQWTVGNTDNSIQALGKCIDVTAAGTANGTNVQLYDCNGSNAQKWTVNGTQLINTGSGKCLDATGVSSADGTRLQIWDCGGGANQQWNLPGGTTPPPTTAPPTTTSAVGPITGYGGKCVDVAGANTANGTAVQLYTCNGTVAQQWTVGNTDNSIQALGKCIDVTAAGTANGTNVQLYDCNGSNAQKWTVNGTQLINTGSGKCLDATGVSSADGTRLQIWDCGGGANQQWNLPGGTTPPPPTAPPTTTPPTTPPSGGIPDLGPNVSIFDPSMSQATIQSKLTSVFNSQQSNQFGSQRFALLFKPGTYNVDANVGFYEQVAGLGFSPDQVTINGAVHAEADWFGGNATQNFWRVAENLSVTPNGGTDRWAVSQAAPYRRIHLRGNLALDDGGWSSGGLIADSRIDGQIRSGSQQQFLTRNTEMGSWSGSNWNMVYVGDTGMPGNSFPSPPYTTVGSTPVTREKPFLYIDGSGNYNVFVPGVRTNAVGDSWSGGNPAGTSLPINQFYIVKAGATAASINAALSSGLNLLFTPGVYHINDTIRINRPDTVVLGLGLATIVPDNGVTGVSVADVNGVNIAGLLLDAGTTNSSVLMEMGPTGSNADHSADPSSLHDVFFRVGGAAVGKATVSLRINSNDVIGDHSWIWRADHGNGVGWTSNTAANGLVVNGNNVTFYGLFVEHYQQYQVIWNGNGGRTYFFQNEIPYDVPNNSSWSSGGGAQGWAAYKVGDSVISHEAWGVGSYCFFSTNPSVVLGHSFEVPSNANVRFHDLVTVSLGGTGTISHVINNTGAAVNSGHQVTDLTGNQ